MPPSVSDNLLEHDVVFKFPDFEDFAQRFPALANEPVSAICAVGHGKILDLEAFAVLRCESD